MAGAQITDAAPAPKADKEPKAEEAALVFS